CALPICRQQPEHHADVEERLNRDHRGEAERQERAEPIGSARRRAQPPPRDHAEAGEDDRRADKPQLLADDGVDEVRLGIWKVEELLDPRHEPAAEDAARSHGNQRLDYLEPVAERILPGIEEYLDALP